MDKERSRGLENIIHIPKSDEVIEYGIALTGADKFTTNIDQWNELLFDWRSDENNAGNILFGDYFFSLERNNKPYCLRTRYFLSQRVDSGIFIPSEYDEQPIYTVSQDTKLELRERHAFPYSRYTDVIRTFAKDLELRVALRED